MHVIVSTSSVREQGPRDRNGASSFIIGERDSIVFEGDAAGAANALRALPVGSSVCVRHARGLRSCMNKPALWSWVEDLAS